jgi:hypothetical protein
MLIPLAGAPISLGDPPRFVPFNPLTFAKCCFALVSSRTLRDSVSEGHDYSMKKLISSPQSAELELFRNMLSDAGIHCEVRNADVSRIVPAPSFYEELWVSDEDYGKASEMLASWQRPPASTAGAWTCPACGEVIEAQFSSCWKCGSKREDLSSPSPIPSA